VNKLERRFTKLGLERGNMIFSGGPHDGEKISTWLPSEATKYIYRSTAIGDETIYRTNSMTGLPSSGDGFVRYYKFYKVWKYDQEETFQPLFNLQINALGNISSMDG
jgi:hypothetical protein